MTSKLNGVVMGFCLELPTAHWSPRCERRWRKASALRTSGPSRSYWGTKLESTVRYLGIEVDDALEISEQTEI
jgi:hypothetical protein